MHVLFFSRLFLSHPSLSFVLSYSCSFIIRDAPRASRGGTRARPLEDRELDAWVVRSDGCNGGLSTGIILEVRSLLYRRQNWLYDCIVL